MCVCVCVCKGYSLRSLSLIRLLQQYSVSWQNWELLSNKGEHFIFSRTISGTISSPNKPWIISPSIMAISLAKLHRDLCPNNNNNDNGSGNRLWKIFCEGLWCVFFGRSFFNGLKLYAFYTLFESNWREKYVPFIKQIEIFKQSV